MTANTEAPSPKKPSHLKQLNVSLPADRYDSLVRAAGREQARTGRKLSVTMWAREILLERAAA